MLIYVLGREGLGTRPAPLGSRVHLSRCLLFIEGQTRPARTFYVVLKGGHYMTTYSVNEVFKQLKALKITSNEESVRRWLRTGKLKGHQNSKKQGWQITEEDLQRLSMKECQILMQQMLY